MWRTFVAAVVAGAVLAATAVVVWRDAIAFAYLRHRVRPVLAFDAAPPPPAPDYASPDAWAALPERLDAADEVPAGADPEAQSEARAAAFYVHPTTYYRNVAWNQPLDDAEVNRFTDEVVRGSATAFNACCRVYAPRYRQAALGALPLFDESGAGECALALAYGDVEAAFAAFLARIGPQDPIVIAAHSQGSLHARWLLERRVAGTPLADRLVAAYLVGYSASARDLAASLPRIPVCATPDATGCVLVWNTVAPGAARLDDITDGVCVNPVTGSADGAYAPHAASAGAVFFPPRAALPWTPNGIESALLALARPPAADGARVEPGAADAQCVDGRLEVREIRSARVRRAPVWGDNHHAWDYALFWMDVRRDVARRVAAFERARPR